MKLVTNVPHYDKLIELVTVKANDLKHDVLHLFVSIEVTMATGEGPYNSLTFTSKFRAKKDVDDETRKYLETFCGRSAMVQEDVLPGINKIAVFYCDEEKQVDILHNLEFLDAVSSSIVKYIFALNKIKE